jgi:hypothetical protein
VTIWGAEGNRILAGRSRDRWESSANVRIQHRKLELHVLEAGIRLPGRPFGVEARNVSGVNLVDV